jgi:hypothetical protein
MLVLAIEKNIDRVEAALLKSNSREKDIRRPCVKGSFAEV